MRSLAHELTARRISTGSRHETWKETRAEAVSWDAPPQGPSRRAVLRRALRQGLLRPAACARDLTGNARVLAANEQIPADH